SAGTSSSSTARCASRHMSKKTRAMSALSSSVFSTRATDLRGLPAEFVKDLGEAVGAGVVGRLLAPIQRSEQAGRPQHQDRMDQEGEHGQLQLAGLDLFDPSD